MGRFAAWVNSRGQFKSNSCWTDTSDAIKVSKSWANLKICRAKMASHDVSARMCMNRLCVCVRRIKKIRWERGERGEKQKISFHQLLFVQKVECVRQDIFRGLFIFSKVSRDFCQLSGRQNFTSDTRRRKLSHKGVTGCVLTTALLQMRITQKSKEKEEKSSLASLSVYIWTASKKRRSKRFFLFQKNLHTCAQKTHFTKARISSCADFVFSGLGVKFHFNSSFSLASRPKSFATSDVEIHLYRHKLWNTAEKKETRGWTSFRITRFTDMNDFHSLFNPPGTFDDSLPHYYSWVFFVAILLKILDMSSGKKRTREGFINDVMGCYWI